MDFAAFVKGLVDGRHKEAETVVLAMDNLDTHAIGRRCAAFAPAAAARRIAREPEIHDTPRHGSRLNAAEVEPSVLGRRRPGRVPDRATLAAHATAVAEERNAAGSSCDWPFRTPDARVKRKRLYPTIDVR